MKPDYNETYRDPNGGEHTLSFYKDPRRKDHVVHYEHNGSGGPWPASKVAAEVKKETDVQPQNIRLYEQSQGGDVSRYDFNQSHTSSVNPDDRPSEGPQKLRSSEAELQKDIQRIEDSRLDLATGPKIDRKNEMKR